MPNTRPAPSRRPRRNWPRPGSASPRYCATACAEAMPEPTIPVRVGRIAREADGINSYELVDPAGGALPEFAAGAHIDVHLPGLEVAAPSPPSPAGGGGGGWG